MSKTGHLASIDLDRKVSREKYKELMPGLEVRLGHLQRRAIQAKLPVVVVFEGAEGAGKGVLINRFIRRLDPRHFRVHSINKVYEEERFRPYLWRFWRRLPAAGKMTVLDRSWYGPILQQRVGKTALEREWQNACEEIKSFERQLCDGGCLIIKIFLHITQEEQAERFLKLESNPATAWRITKQDWIHHENYDSYCTYAEEMLAQSDNPQAPWQLISATHLRAATVDIFATTCRVLEQALDAKEAGKFPEASPPRLPVKKGKDPLKKVDPGLTISREKYREELDALQEEVGHLAHQIYVDRVPVVVVYEGWDAAGKGGNIKRLTQSMDPRGYEVFPVAAPNDIERKHHYLWRFWRDIPKAGHVGIYDRSWYGRVLVERVEGFCTEDEWRRAYQEINEFERQLTSYGTVLVKFWLQIDKDEQLRRFEARQQDPHRKWKITDEDWRNRDKWDQYQEAVRDMLVQTSTETAPWTVVESNSKHYARLKALRTVVASIRQALD